MSPAKIVVFDIIGTCFSLEKLRQTLIEFGAPNCALELWFARSLRDAFAFSHAGGYKPLKEILQAELPLTLQTFDLTFDSNERAQIMSGLKELELQHSAREAFEALANEGWEIMALTNGSQDFTYDLLDKEGVKSYFTGVYSCDAIAKTKPHPEVYQMIPVDNLSEVWLVAAHAWDIAGAIKAGMKTAFVTQLEGSYLDVYPQPVIIAEDLLTAARQIVNS